MLKRAETRACSSRDVCHRLARGVVCLLIAVVMPVLLAACSNEYDRNTPEGTIATARHMITNGDAKRLGELIYTNNEDEARLMRRLGRMLGNLNSLGDAIQQKFPEDVAKLKARAEESAKAGKGGTMVNRLFSEMNGQRQRRKAAQGQRPGQETEQLFNDLLKTIFADPYGWLKESQERLTTAYMTEDLVAVLWDGKPILPPIGVTMRKDAKGQWAFVVPNNLPGVRDFWPKSQDEFQIWGGLIQVFDNVVIDLTKDVQEGRATSLDDVARRAGEKTFVPAVITVFAFGQLQEAQKKELKAKKEAEQKAHAVEAKAPGNEPKKDEPKNDESKNDEPKRDPAMSDAPKPATAEPPTPEPAKGP